MQPPLTVLISSAGRRVELLQIWRAAIQGLGRVPRIIAVDMTRLSAAWQVADAGYLVPHCQAPAFIDELLGICQRENVSLIVPTIDPELPVYAAAHARFEAIGVRVHVSAPEVIAISNDKRLTHRWLTSSRLPTVSQVDARAVLDDGLDLPLPAFAKPAMGSSAIGIAKVESREALSHWVGERTDYIVQEVAPGVEYTVDVFVDREGRCRAAVPRRRLEIRAGEVSKGMTVRHARVMDLATRAAESLPGAWGCLNIQIFADDESQRLSVIEINSRFGGSFPLTWEAGGHFPRWILEEVLSLPCSAHPDWTDGLIMLRYDAAVFRDKAACGL